MTAHQLSFASFARVGGGQLCCVSGFLKTVRNDRPQACAGSDAEAVGQAVWRARVALLTDEDDGEAEEVGDWVSVQTAAGALILDARGRNRYRGEIEPIDPRPGHIPGSLSAPYVENLKASHGPLLPLEALRSRYERLGAVGSGDDRDVICSCGSGVTACHDIWVLHLLGRTNTKLYEGSWSDWSSDPSLPAASGPEPGG